MTHLQKAHSSPITTHVLDTALGRPAGGMTVVLEFFGVRGWRELGRGKTDPDGRVKDLLPGERPGKGLYRLIFWTGAYFRARGVRGFYPSVSVLFQVREPVHHHVPLLLSPFGYSTYRGS